MKIMKHIYISTYNKDKQIKKKQKTKKLSTKVQLAKWLLNPENY